MRACTVLVVVSAAATAAAAPVTGTVHATRARWDGGVIVTEVDVVTADGARATVTQLGGTIAGLGMRFSHAPAVAEPGDVVEVDGARLARIASRVRIAAAGGGTASYGVQRTTVSGKPLWRDSACLEMVYDSATVTPDQARVLDAAFATWSGATASCGGLQVTTWRAPVADTADGINTVHIRRDRWCRPATPTSSEVCFDPEAASTTRILYIDDPADENDGKIVETDMELDAVDYALLAPGEPAPSGPKPVLDLQSVATHEAGHVLGLAHDCGTGAEAWPEDHAGTPVPSCESTDATVLGATMYYRLDSGDIRRSLSPNDVAGACTITRGLVCETAVVGGCSAGGGGLGLGLVPLVWLVRRRRPLTGSRAS